ncbi:mannose-1-phosphate guanylyltransferase/mannose-6-phosphate isomerase [Halomonas sp. HP20-15]|uniref:mannose-1-phosphate guanylyltransferase/mannose-6-phosphate isomerase n=1 Tax=Halomonas sp. HP20-15 TaxID=3085901 RepID=UPI0029813FC6|nr:mannose-1-phosphate guanylyltransferase/mannose-6-phosphate isomerase [Halomonas sp. HP20-15]MDW5375439.1 mannose-1-phosphate guanylyltransferase/mannose-6-phosphate isomerase [Halomonas sp. HP20-15]
MLTPVLLAGGSGTRLWPLSRAAHPKQFQPLLGASSLLQATLERLAGQAMARPIVVCQQDHRFLVAEQLREIGVTADIILEPEGRNTAPAIALAALCQSRRDPEGCLLVLPADHYLADPAALHAVLVPAETAARSGQLVALGVRPHTAETGYGYIEIDGDIATAIEATEARPIMRFVEKPDRETAERFVREGRHLWNSGMFTMRADRYLEELSSWCPAIFDAVTAAWDGLHVDLDFMRVETTRFLACPADSIDYAVMERTDRVAVVPLASGWSDVGSWQALWESAEHDKHGNALAGDVLIEAVEESLIYSESRLVAALGVSGLIVVETADAVLVADREQSQAVKGLVARLRAQGREEGEIHRRVYRPWGSYERLHRGPRFQVKYIRVRPTGRLSLQKHHHRAEHWVVVSGTARVTRGDECFLLTENQSTYIPLGMVHRLENPGHIDLEMIEVQSGSYLGEDDIQRLDDSYRRE